jgi:hypothetical protein
MSPNAAAAIRLFRRRLEGIKPLALWERGWGEGIQALQLLEVFPPRMMGWTPPDGIYVPVCGLLESHTKEASVEEVSIIGLDLAKRIFQAHGGDKSSMCLFSRKLSRAQLLGFFKSQKPCIVAMEACSSAHYWGREIAALGH